MVMTTTTPTTMTTDPDAFLSALRLADSFLPVGGYTASYGLEQYLNEDKIDDRDDLEAVIAAYLRRVVGPVNSWRCRTPMQRVRQTISRRYGLSTNGSTP